VAKLEFLNPAGQWETLMLRKGRPLKHLDHAEGGDVWQDSL
jgi:hypothetical protein